MVNVTLSYNPYLVRTSISWEDHHIDNNSELNIPFGVRLQEWIEQLPSRLSKETNDKVHLKFIGTKTDYEDVKAAFKNSDVPYELEFEEKYDVDEAEKLINGIFKDIQNGPIEELKTDEIRNTFKKAKSSEFEVNVVATMSSGKSTLINALLGKKLMPAKNEATTATIVKIKDVDGKKDFSAKAYDNRRNLIESFPKVTLKDMQSLNDNKDVYEIDIEGDIKFVSSEGMTLVLVDTPGPNNARDIHHQEMTFKMLENSDKSLVLFVMNGRQLGINDEKIFLDFICTNMKEGGKKTRDRYIFAVNQMDAFKPTDEDDGKDCIRKALTSVLENLNERGINDANIFPVSAGVALEKRIDDEDEELLHPFSKKSRKYSSMRLNDYYEFTHQPLTIREKINDELAGLEDDKDKVEYYSGIRNIEEAIRLYINKYARTTKVCDLVLAFNSKLNEMATIASLEDSIRRDSNSKERLEKEIKRVEEIIKNAQSSKSFSDEIERINYSESAIKDIQFAINNAKRQFHDLMSGKSDKVDVKQAETQCKTIAAQYNQCAAQINVRVNGIIQSSFRTTMSKVISEYLRQLSKAGIGYQNLNIGSFSGITISVPNLDGVVNVNTKTYDESYDGTEAIEVVDPSTRGRNAGVGGLAAAGIGAICGGPIGALIGGCIGLLGGLVSGHDDKKETQYRPKRIEKYADYVNMNEVATAASNEFNGRLEDLETKAREYLVKETEALKDKIKDKISDIDRLLQDKLDDLKAMRTNTKRTAEEIAIKEKNMKWLIGIRERVNDLIEF
jgi:GTPase Era involved in 16S rRNA processing/gas vesicle protein